VVPHWHYRTWGQQRGRSRNKVAVGEPAAGSPPLNEAGRLCVKGHFMYVLVRADVHRCVCI
jgi:hypothetical protein